MNKSGNHTSNLNWARSFGKTESKKLDWNWQRTAQTCTLTLSFPRPLYLFVVYSLDCKREAMIMTQNIIWIRPKALVVQINSSNDEREQKDTKYFLEERREREGEIPAGVLLSLILYWRNIRILTYLCHLSINIVPNVARVWSAFVMHKRCALHFQYKWKRKVILACSLTLTYKRMGSTQISEIKTCQHSTSQKWQEFVPEFRHRQNLLQRFIWFLSIF